VVLPVCLGQLAYVPQIVLGIVPQWGWSPIHMPKNVNVSLAVGTLRDFLNLGPYETIACPIPDARALNRLGRFLLPAMAAAGIAGSILTVALRRWPRLSKVCPNLTRYVAPSPSSGGSGNLTWLPVAWFGAVFILPFAIARTAQPVFHYQYVVGAMPAYCWLIGVAVAALPHRWPRLALGILCPLLAVPSLVTMKVVPMRENWRGCAQAIAAEERPGDHIVVWPDFSRQNFNLYYHGSLPETSVPSGQADKEITKALSWTEPPQRVWLVVGPNPLPGPTIIHYFEARPDYRLTRRREQEFRGIILMLFEYTPPGSSPPKSGNTI